ncbi:MAG: 50S ribosomal protein L24 [Phycisphaeraceae bacterium]|nr:50S ribosomal protein L24 [Phycisphaeraceae bacterium]MCB9847288.1 50S ribosomal protein L24 [Phycisphaeraceae bacterium]
MPRHVRKGDTVIVTSGKDKGKTGAVLHVYPADDRVLVQGVNMVTKNIRPTQANPQGGVVHREAAIHISNVSPVIDGKPSRVRFERKADGSKVRVAVRGGSELGVVHGPREKKPGGAPAPAATRKKTAKKASKKAQAKKTAKKAATKKSTKKTAKKAASKKSES